MELRKKKSMVVLLIAMLFVNIVLMGTAITFAYADGIETDLQGDMIHEFESGEDFGSHVVEHAHSNLFTGDHNPGVHHRGYSFWRR